LYNAIQTTTLHNSTVIKCNTLGSIRVEDPTPFYSVYTELNITQYSVPFSSVYTEFGSVKATMPSVEIPTRLRVLRLRGTHTQPYIEMGGGTIWQDPPSSSEIFFGLQGLEKSRSPPRLSSSEKIFRAGGSGKIQTPSSSEIFSGGRVWNFQGGLGFHRRQRNLDPPGG